MNFLASFILIFFVASIGHCADTTLAGVKEVALLAQNVVASFGQELVMEDIQPDVSKGAQITLEEALTRVLNNDDLAKAIKEIIDELRRGLICRVYKYAAIMSKLGVRTIDMAKHYQGDTESYIIAYAKAVGLVATEAASTLVHSFYSSMAASEIKSLQGKLTAIEATVPVDSNDIVKMGAKGAIHDSVTKAAENAALEMSKKIEAIFNRADGSFVEAMKEFVAMKNANMDRFQKKIEEIIVTLKSRSYTDPDEAFLHQFAADLMPMMIFNVAAKISGDVFNSSAVKALEFTKSTLEIPQPYLAQEHQDMLKVLIEELDKTIGATPADPDAPRPMLEKVFGWATKKIADECTAATDHKTLYEPLVGPIIVDNAFSERQLTVNWLIDDQVVVQEKLKAEYAGLPDIWKAKS